MTVLAIPSSPAEAESERALKAVYECLNSGDSFRLEAGAGAGKTYTLVKALEFLIKRDGVVLPKRHQRIACITFTNVAKDEIVSRTGGCPLVHCDTIHAFCWSVISNFQKQLKEGLQQIEKWGEILAENGPVERREIKYSFGYRDFGDLHVSLHHDDVISLTVWLLNESAKFRDLLTKRYPVILIDEYQDTNSNWIDAVKTNLLDGEVSPQFGFFGDHWQKIYGSGCGKIEHPRLVTIEKGANFRSVPLIVSCLTRMRPELPQAVDELNVVGSVSVFHTNTWTGQRQTSQHWKGDLPDTQVNISMAAVKQCLMEVGWTFSVDTTKVLMLTHRVLANQQGYSNLPSVFRFNEAFTKKEHPHIAFFADVLEPCCTAFSSKRYGEMFQILGRKRPNIKCHGDKSRWSEAMAELLILRSNNTIGEVIDHLRNTGLPQIPNKVERLESKLADFDGEKEAEMPRSLKELEQLRSIAYTEIIALSKYLTGHSPFETKHGVKGAEFQNVLLVVGRGWNHYDFNKMLEQANSPEDIPPGNLETYERNRNLFYVACSRAKQNLAIVFTQELSPEAMNTVSEWFGAECVHPIQF